MPLQLEPEIPDPPTIVSISVGGAGVLTAIVKPPSYAGVTAISAYTVTGVPTGGGSAITVTIARTGNGNQVRQAAHACCMCVQRHGMCP